MVACHRRIIADYLHVPRPGEVIHLMGEGANRTRAASLPRAKERDGHLVYPASPRGVSLAALSCVARAAERATAVVAAAAARSRPAA